MRQTGQNYFREYLHYFQESLENQRDMWQVSNFETIEKIENLSVHISDRDFQRDVTGLNFREHCENRECKYPDFRSRISTSPRYRESRKSVVVPRIFKTFSRSWIRGVLRDIYKSVWHTFLPFMAFIFPFLNRGHRTSPVHLQIWLLQNFEVR